MQNILYHFISNHLELNLAQKHQDKKKPHNPKLMNQPTKKTPQTQKNPKQNPTNQNKTKNAKQRTKQKAQGNDTRNINAGYSSLFFIPSHAMYPRLSLLHIL